MHDFPSDAMPDETALFAGGCFWSIEAVFQHVRGVTGTEPGYVWMEPGVPGKPSAERHLAQRMEVVRVHWNPSVITLEKMLDIFFATTSPTLVPWDSITELSPNRSAIFVCDQGQREVAEQHLMDVKVSGRFEDPVHTQVLDMPPFELAEMGEQDFYLNHPRDGFCTSIVKPKIDKLRAHFASHYRKAVRSATVA